MQAGECIATECSSPTFPGYDYCYHCYRADQHAQELAAAQAERERLRALAKQQRKERKAAERVIQPTGPSSRRSGPRRRRASAETKPVTSRPRGVKQTKKKPPTYWICTPCGVAVDDAKARCVSCGRGATSGAASTHQNDRGTAPQRKQGSAKEGPQRTVQPRSPVGSMPLQSKPRPAIVKAPPTLKARALKPPPEKLPERSPGWWETNDRW
ncbi:hypothetical protein GCM10010320_20260 [Streptomyces caelestis]|nr:hypothetical protein GCM10010320_20260 [Streptomyces caelestis]